jgi:hypothetical protein
MVILSIAYMRPIHSFLTCELILLATINASPQALVRELATSVSFRASSRVDGPIALPEGGRCVVASGSISSGLTQIVVVKGISATGSYGAETIDLKNMGVSEAIAIEPSGSIVVAESSDTSGPPGTNTSVSLRLLRYLSPDMPPVWASPPFFKCGYLYSVKLFAGPSQSVHVVCSFADTEAADSPRRTHVCEVDSNGIVVWENMYSTGGSLLASRSTIVDDGFLVHGHGERSRDRKGAFLGLITPRSNKSVEYPIIQLETIRCILPSGQSEVVVAGELPLQMERIREEFALLRRIPSRQTALVRYRLDDRTMVSYPIRKSHPRVEERISDLISTKVGFAALFTVIGTPNDFDRGKTRSMNQERSLWWRLLDPHGEMLAEAELVRTKGGIAYDGRLISLDSQTYIVTCAVEGSYSVAGRESRTPSDKPDMLLLQVDYPSQ